MPSQIVATPNPLKLFSESAKQLQRSIDVLYVDLPFDPFEPDGELAWEDKWRRLESLGLMTLKLTGFLITPVKPHALALMMDVFSLRWNFEHFVSVSPPTVSTSEYQIHDHLFYFVWTRSGVCLKPRSSVAFNIKDYIDEGNFVVELFGKSLQHVGENTNYLGVPCG